jgi:hypothetical protein
LQALLEALQRLKVFVLFENHQVAVSTRLHAAEGEKPFFEATLQLGLLVHRHKLDQVRGQSVPLLVLRVHDVATDQDWLLVFDIGALILFERVCISEFWAQLIPLQD